MRKIITITLLFLALSLGVFLIGRKNNEPDLSTKTKIVTSFYPLYFFVSQIGGEAVEVKNITPAGAEPHDYEPTTADISAIEDSSLLILNGVSFEPWGEKVKGIINENVVVLEVAEGLADKEVIEEGEKIPDPHIWLDPVLAKALSEKILTELIKVDPKNKNFYEARAKALIGRLDTLDGEFLEGLKNCNNRNIVTSHEAFGYVARRYDLEQIGITGISPDTEPSAREIAEIAEFAKANNVKYIFFETLLSPKLAQTIASEIGAQTLVFNPIEGLTPEEENRGEDYFSLQRENLINLKTALECR